ncbi:MAG: hypothetical protein FWC41_10780 [Firmicutes bacterium]|nr:hypothetical protein [Bacillota bacterium]
MYQEIIRMALEPQFEANFESTSYGFRRGCKVVGSYFEKWHYLALNHDLLKNNIDICF